jgi:hypothetical protein
MAKKEPNEYEDIIAYLRSIRRLLKSAEVCRITGWHRETFYRKVRNGLKCIKDGGRWKTDSMVLADYLEDRSTGTTR